MINQLIKSISFIFHPILMPMLGVVFYFSKTPRFIPGEIVQAKVFSILILTIVLPILTYYLLKTIGRARSIYMNEPKERIIPLFLNCLIVLLIILKVFPSAEVIELYYFFIGVLISTFCCLILAFFDFKASIHMIAVSGVYMFFIALSMHFSININGTLALMAILTGAIASSRLQFKAHTYIELFIGILIGVIPQLTLITYWL